MYMTQPSLHILGGSRFYQTSKSMTSYRIPKGNYWISTKRSGIFVYPGLQNGFYSQDNSSLPDNRFSTMGQTDDGRLLLGFQDGTWGKIFDPVKDNTTSFIVDSKRTREVKSILHDPAQNLIWTTGGNFLYGFDMEGNKVIEGRNGGGEGLQIYQDHLLRATPYDADVHSLISGYGNKPPLSRELRKHFTNLAPPTYSFHTLILREERAFSIFGDEEQEQIWVGYADGLYLYEKNGDFQIISLPDSSNILASSLARTEDGTIWVGTPAQGVIGIRDGKIQYHFHQQNRLPTSNCRWLETEGSQVWIGSDEGVFLIEPNSEHIWMYGRQDALPSNDIRGLSLIDEWVYVATPIGVCRFLKEEMRAEKSSYPTFLTGVALYERDTLLEDGVRLSHNQNNLRFSFLGLAYRPQGYYQYKYRMLGLDSSWVEIPSSQRIARFPSLPAGSYTFEVTTQVPGASNDQAPARFSFSIDIPYWQRWWFWALIFLGLIGLTSLGFMYRIQVLKERNRIDQELRTAQLSAIKSQMNPHFMFNALNSIQDFILLNEKRQANLYLGKFADLMRLYLNLSNQTSVILADIIKALDLYLQLEGIRFDDTFNYLMDVH